MAQVHGKNTVILVDGTDISDFCDNSTFPRMADSHDLTTYGKDAHVFKGGLKNATFDLGGVYDNAESDTPRVLFEGNEGSDFTITRRVEGTGSGKPQALFTGVLTNYTETSPVADYVRWTASFQVSDSIDYTPQS